jgi:hypothetical protein
MSKLESVVNDNDFNAKKNLEELDEKVQVERCVNEMVAWVAESVQLTDNAKKMNKMNKNIATATSKAIAAQQAATEGTNIKIKELSQQ